MKFSSSQNLPFPNGGMLPFAISQKMHFFSGVFVSYLAMIRIREGGL